MGAIYSAIQMGATWCCCATVSSLCNNTLGSTGVKSTGRKRSVLLLSLVIATSLFFQYSLAPSILHENRWWKLYSSVPGMGKQIKYAFTDGCQNYKNDGEMNDHYAQCVANAAVYRPTLISTLFFTAMSIITKYSPSQNREIWPAKYSIYFLTLFVTLFLPNRPIFTTIYVIVMRICASIFIVLQQVILIDMAYNWNEFWVMKSNLCESREWGSGRKWLQAIVICTILLFLGTLVGISFLYQFFAKTNDGSDTFCGGNITIITITLLIIIVMTVVQLIGSDGEGSLLTTSVIAAYSTYLAYSTLSKNPNAQCNPTMMNDDDEFWSIGIGLFFTMISLIWTGWSWTATDRLDTSSTLVTTHALTPTDPQRPDAASLDLETPFLEENERPTTGLVVTNPGSSNDEEQFNARHADTLYKLNIVLVLISCWVAASLTEWGTIVGSAGGDDGSDKHTAANPLVGRLNMIMIGLSQNLAMGLYLWTLLAPKLFPDRDFS